MLPTRAVRAQIRATALVAIAAARLDALTRSGLALGEARNRCAQRLIFAARAHCQLILIRDFRAFLRGRAAEPQHAGLLPVLTKLFVVLALFLIERHMGDFQTSGCVVPHAALAMVSLISLIVPFRANPAHNNYLTHIFCFFSLSI